MPLPQPVKLASVEAVRERRVKPIDSFSFLDDGDTVKVKGVGEGTSDGCVDRGVKRGAKGSGEGGTECGTQSKGGDRATGGAGVRVQNAAKDGAVGKQQTSDGGAAQVAPRNCDGLPQQVV